MAQAFAGCGRRWLDSPLILHLFRELGELLVGRDSTALIELIKNSYDADATEVIVHGESLDDQLRGRIIILETEPA